MYLCFGSLREGATPRAQILVVDDEARVLSMLDRILSRRHDVTLASDGVEALALIAGGRRFDRVLCDLMMPRMTGMELFDRVKESAPDQADASVFLSGGAVTERGADFLEKHADRQFDKPFQLEDLEEMIATRLTGEE